MLFKKYLAMLKEKKKNYSNLKNVLVVVAYHRKVEDNLTC